MQLRRFSLLRETGNVRIANAVKDIMDMPSKDEIYETTIGKGGSRIDIIVQNLHHDKHCVEASLTRKQHIVNAYSKNLFPFRSKRKKEIL